MSIRKSLFGYLPNGRAVTKYTMQVPGGISCSILDLGGILQQLLVPDAAGRMADVVCGFETAEAYSFDKAYHGAVIGRVANRIANGIFTLQGKTYTLTKNLGNHSHHGGVCGLSRRFWQVTPREGDQPSLVLHYDSPDGEEGYPANLSVTVTYTLKSPMSLCVHYEATTDAPTPVNLSHHAYFNLGGYHGKTVADHVLWLDAPRYLEPNEDKLPTGRILSVDGTPLDFGTPKPVGKDLHADFPAMQAARGYDFCYCFDGEKAEPVHRATLTHPESGREMKLYTTQPALHLYTANFCNESLPLKGGYPQQPHFALCLETQKMPDSVHHPHFTNTVLLPGEKYDHTTEYVFSVIQL